VGEKEGGIGGGIVEGGENRRGDSSRRGE